MPEVRIFKDKKGEVQLFSWLASVKKHEPAVYRKCLAWIKELQMQGFRLQRPIAAPLRDDIHELRPKSGHVNYRILYFFVKNKAILAHGLTKEDVVPVEDIDYAIRCRQLVQDDLDRYTATLPDDFFE